MMRNDDNHWLTRPATIRRLWQGAAVVLTVLVLAELIIEIKGYFGIDELFGFGALFGFGSCVLMVLVAKALGVVLKRREDYYDRDGSTHDD